MASAGLPYTAFQTWVWMTIRAGTSLISRLGALDDDSERQTMSSKTREPMRYPSVLSLGMSEWAPRCTVEMAVPPF